MCCVWCVLKAKYVIPGVFKATHFVHFVIISEEDLWYEGYNNVVWQDQFASYIATWSILGGVEHIIKEASFKVMQ